MNRSHVIATILISAALAVTTALARMAGSADEYDLAWHTIDGGGGTSTAGGFAVVGTIGQPDAGPIDMTGGTFTLSGGFWTGLGPTINTCPPDIAPPGGNGLINVDDLLLVISAWGPCPAPPSPASCPADIAPPGGNQIVNVDDLLTIISAWGACP